jgi:hypothetical protein
MDQQRFAALPALGGAIFVIGWAAVLAELAAGLHNGTAPTEAATPQATARAKDGRASFSDRFSDWASVAAAVPEPQMLPPATAPALASTPDPVQEIAAPPVEVARIASVGAAVPEPVILRPASPPAAIVPSTPDPVQDVVEAAVPPVEVATIGSAGAAVPEPQMLPPVAPVTIASNAPDPVQEVVETAAPPVEVALGSAGPTAPEPQILPPAAPPVTIAPSTPDPVPDVVEAARPVEVAAIGSAVEPQMPPPATPAVAIVPSTPDPVQDCIDAPVETAATENGGAAGPRPPVRLVSLFRPEPLNEDLKPALRPVETLNECLVVEICIDDYLWSFYELTPKIDTNKVTHRIKTTIKKKGKLRTVTRTITKYVAADFTWKDPIAAQKAGLSVKDYVIGGMDRRFKLKLYHAFRAMDDAGLMPGITSAFRDDYRQAIASGNKAASDSSYHGGSRRGGYGHGLAADLVSLKGETRMQRWASTVELWKWIDAREKELGIGRPYLDRDPPHVGPIDGREFAVKRGGAKAKRVGPAKKRHPVVVAGNPGVKNSATKAGPVRMGSI